MTQNVIVLYSEDTEGHIQQFKLTLDVKKRVLTIKLGENMTMNQFLQNAVKYAVLTENGAVAHASIGSALADQFSSSGSHRGRTLATVFAEQSALHAESPNFALRFPFYLRLITRKINGDNETDTVQRGQGNRDEAFKRLLWYVTKFPEAFYGNLSVLTSVGSFKDIWDLADLAKKNDISIDMSKLFAFYQSALNNVETSDLAKKFLPTIHSPKRRKTTRSTQRTTLGKNFARFLGLNEKQYRKLKASGHAHEFQQQISQSRFNDIKFSRLPGRALNQLGTSKFFKNHDLEEPFLKWLSSKPTVPFTGYVYELGAKVTHNKVLANAVIDKQFEGLIALAKKDTGGISGNVWCALDTSGSMASRVANTTAYDICVSLGIFFSTLNEGAFHKNVVMFDSTSELKKLSGSFSDMWNQIKSSSTAWGSTNFQSVIDLMVRVRQQNPNIPLTDYPETLLVISDMQFNPTGSNNTNHEEAISKLSKVFPAEFVKNFKVIWWDCSGRVTSNKPTHISEGGTYVFSGFDGSILTLLLGGEVREKQTITKVEVTLEESIATALNQDVLKNVVFPKG